MDRLQISFADGNVLGCVGTLVETGDGELRGNEDGTFTEVRDSVQFKITEGYITILNDHGYGPTKICLKPGLYLINDDGLWQHI